MGIESSTGEPQTTMQGAEPVAELNGTPAEATVSAGVGALRPGVVLCVDLDGTLVKSDTLLDTVLVVARQKPLELVHVPGWIAQGRAAFKRHLTQLVTLDVEHLPYNRPLLEYLLQQYGEGRAIYLATAADKGLAERVAAHLGIFAGVLASEGGTNLAGGNKLAAFRAKFGDEFCYIGNARPDVALLAACESPMVANPDRALLAGMKRTGTVAAARFEDRGPAMRSWLKAIRLHQWAKNALIFVPLLLAHQWHLRMFGAAITAFFSFGVCASATYIVNDLLDLEADRRHPSKRRRPFAAGDLSAISGVAVVCVLMLVAAGAGAGGSAHVHGIAGECAAGAAVQLSGVAGALYGGYSDVLAVFEAEAAAGRVCAERAVYGAAAGGQRGDGDSDFGVAGGVQRVLLLVAGVCEAVQRAGESAGAGRIGDQWARVLCERPGTAACAGNGRGVCGGGGVDAVHQ